MDEQSGISRSEGGENPHVQPSRLFAEAANRPYFCFGDEGGASRFFYVAKVSPSERNRGCEALPERPAGALEGKTNDSLGTAVISKNTHPTLKPVELLRWLARLVTPPGGVILDPFAGSASMGVAALLENFAYVGMECEGEYIPIALARLRDAANLVGLFAEED